MLSIDFWYNNTKEDITGASCSFYPNDGEYRGNIYNGNKMIGDYFSDDSVEIEKYFRKIGFEIFG